LSAAAGLSEIGFGFGEPGVDLLGIPEQVFAATFDFFFGSAFFFASFAGAIRRRQS